MADGWLRARALLDRWFEVAVVALVIVAALGGWVAYGAHAAPPTESEERVVDSWETTTEYGHEARVVNDTTVFAEGSVVSDREVYYTSVMPELDATHRFGYDAGEGSLDVAAEAELLVEGVEDTADAGDEPATYWQLDRPLERANATGVAPGEEVTLSFAVNASELAERSRQIEEELGGTQGEIRTRVVTTVDLTGTVDGEPVERTLERSMGIDAGDGTYWITGDEATTDTDERTETVTVPAEYGPLRTAGGPLLALVGLVGLAGLAGARHRGRLALSERERAALAYADDRADFEEWITRVSLADEVLDGPESEAESLADLVDYAIDADEGVIEDPGRNAFFVFHDGRRFAYYPPAEAVSLEHLPDDDAASDPLDGGATPGSPDDAVESAPPDDVASATDGAPDGDPPTTDQ